MRAVCVIIVTFNAQRWLVSSLESLKRSNHPIDIYVYDNQSSDETISIIEDLYPNVQLIKGATNIGFGNANNVLMKECYQKGYDYFFLLNQDAYIHQDTVERLVSGMEADERIGILSPIHLNGSGTELDKSFAYYARECNLKAEEHLITDVPFVNAAAWMLRRATLEEVGIFHPFFYHYAEDRNYCQRVLASEMKISIATQSFVRHDREGDTKVLKQDSWKTFKRSLLKNILDPRYKYTYWFHIDWVVVRFRQDFRHAKGVAKVRFAVLSLPLFFYYVLKVAHYRMSGQPGLYLDVKNKYDRS